MERDKIIMLLRSQDYLEFMLEQTADKIERLTPSVAQAFEIWSDSREVPEMEIYGYTYFNLIKDFGMKPIAAFLALDWLTRESKKASAALKRGIRKIII